MFYCHRFRGRQDSHTPLAAKEKHQQRAIKNDQRKCDDAQTEWVRLLGIWKFGENLVYSGHMGEIMWVIYTATVPDESLGTAMWVRRVLGLTLSLLHKSCRGTWGLAGKSLCTSATQHWKYRFEHWQSVGVRAEQRGGGGIIGWALMRSNRVSSGSPGSLSPLSSQH